MAAYKGGLNLIPDGDNFVIPISLLTTDIASDGLTIDVSGIRSPSGDGFGYIAGVTIDASNTNVAAGIISILPLGGYNLVRTINGGSTQVIQVSGQCQQLIIKNTGWISGSISLVIWNSKPTSEISSPVNVVANIASGNVNVTNANINTSLSPLNTSGAAAFNLAANATITLVPFVAGKSVIVVGLTIHCYNIPGAGSCNLNIQDVSGTPVIDWGGVVFAGAALLSVFQLVSISGLAMLHPVGNGIAAVVAATTFGAGASAVANVYYRLV